MRTVFRGFLFAGLKRNMLLSLTQSIVGLCTALAAYRILVNETSIEVLGLWTLINGIVALIRIADVSGGSGLNRLVAVAVLKTDGPAPVIDTVTTFIAVLYALVALIAIVPFQTLAAASIDGEYHALSESLVVWVLGTLLLAVVSTSQLNALDGIRRADLHALIQITGFLIYLATAAILIPVHNVFGIAMAQVVQFLFVIVGARLFLVQMIPKLRVFPTFFSLCELRAALVYGAKLQLANVAQLIFLGPGLRLVVNYAGGLGFVAIFDVAQKLTSAVSALAAAATRPIVPEFSRSNELDLESRNQLYVRLTRVQVPSAAIAFIGSCCVGPLVAWFVFGSVPYAFLSTFAGLSLGWFVFTATMPSLMLARGAGILRWNIIGQWAITILGVALGIISAALGSNFIGAAIGLALVLGSLIQLTGNTRVYKLPITSVFATRFTIVSTLLFLISLGLLVAVESMNYCRVCD